jgi:hypothetical protein
MPHRIPAAETRKKAKNFSAGAGIMPSTDAGAAVDGFQGRGYSLSCRMQSSVQAEYGKDRIYKSSDLF